MEDNQYKGIPERLRQIPQWVARKGKIPVNPDTGKNAQANNPATWSGFGNAVMALSRYADQGVNGIGIMCGSGLCAIDIDHCINNGELSPLAAEIVDAMDSYTEMSLSGTGVHIYFTGVLEERSDLYTKNPENGLEIYSEARHIAITGNSLGDPRPLAERSKEAEAVREKHMRRPKTPSRSKEKAPTGTKLSPEEILLKMKASKNCDKYSKLLAGDMSDYNSHSEADMALCVVFAFYSGGDADTIDSMFRASKLFRAEKWDRQQSGSTYGAITIKNAIDSCPEFYNPLPSQSVYFEENGNVYRRGSGKERHFLANFTTKPLEDIKKDNGTTDETRLFTFSGRLYNGEILPPISVPSEQFASMSWINKYWGLIPCIQPGQANTAYYRAYIQSQAADAERKTIYTHTGFRAINNKLCWLHHGGALGAENIECELEKDLSKYTFIDRGDTTEQEALAEVMRLFQLTAPEISYPLLAFTFLTPLIHFMDKAGISPRFSLFLKGETGSFKTTIGVLYLAHFRQYGGMSESPPTSFRSTSGAIERLGFSLKDTPLLVDDYYPAKSISDKKRLDTLLEGLARGGGDNVSRARLNSDATLKTSHTPRGLTMVTGEDMPNLEPSALARFYFVNFGKGTVDLSQLTERQNNARLLNVAMQFYILWLIKNADTLPNSLKEFQQYYIRRVQIADSHSRMSATVVSLLIGIGTFCDYANHIGIMSEAEVCKFCDDALKVFIDSGAEQTRTQAEERPYIKFLSVLDELFTSGRAYTVDKMVYNDNERKDRFLGYHDEDYLYLLPETTYTTVNEHFLRNGENFTASKNALFAQLAKQGLIETQGGKNTVKARLPAGSPTPKGWLTVKKSVFDNLKGNDENGL